MLTIKVFLDSDGRIADLQKDFPLYQGQYQNKLLTVYVPVAILSPNFTNLSYIGQKTVNTLEDIDDVLDSFVQLERGREKLVGDIVEVIYENQEEEPTETTYYRYTATENGWTSEEVSHFSANGLFGTSVKIGCISVKRNGEIRQSESRYMRYVKNISQNGEEYAIYERKLPKEFTYYAGEGENATTIVINVVNIDTQENKVVSLITSQTCKLEVMPSSDLDQDAPVEPSEIETIWAEINGIKNIAEKKQDKAIPNSATNEKTVELAINELKGDTTANALENERQNGEISGLDDRVETLESLITNTENYIGTYEYEASSVQDLPTDNELLAFVRTIKGQEYDLQIGDVVFVVQQIEDETDKNYKYFYNGTSWVYYEIPPIQKAKNGVAGLVAGTYGVGKTYDALVDIESGEIKNIYIKYENAYVNLRTFVVQIKGTQNGIIDGTQVVGKATKAIQDELGNNIVNTYLTKDLGATKQFVKNYALPNEFNDVHYLVLGEETDTYQKERGGEQSKDFTLSSGENTTLSATYTLDDVEFQLSNKNRYISKFYVSVSQTIRCIARLSTFIKHGNEQEITADVSILGEIEISSSGIHPIEFESNFTSLTNVLYLQQGDKIRQELSFLVFSAESMLDTTMTIYSGVYLYGSFYLSTVGNVIVQEYAKKGEIEVINTDELVKDEIVTYPNTYMAQFIAPPVQEFYENAEYLVQIPKTSGLNEDYKVYLRCNLRGTTRHFPIIMPYQSTVATLSELYQTSNANNYYRFVAIFENDTFVAEQPKLSRIRPLDYAITQNLATLYNGIYYNRTLRDSLSSQQILIKEGSSYTLIENGKIFYYSNSGTTTINDIRSNGTQIQLGANRINMNKPVSITGNDTVIAISPTVSLMNDLKGWVDEVEENDQHCFFDLHTIIDNAYLCTVLFYTENTTNYCIIYDIINGKMYLNYKGYQDDDTIAEYLATSESNLPTIMTITDDTTTISEVIELCNSAQAQGHHLFFDFDGVDDVEWNAICTASYSNVNDTFTIISLSSGTINTVPYGDGTTTIGEVLEDLHPIEKADATITINSANYTTLDDSQSTAVPNLTVAQVNEIISQITLGKVVYIKDFIGTNISLVRQKATIDSNPTVYITYLDRLEVVYTVNNNAVVITYKEISGVNKTIKSTTQTSITATLVKNTNYIYGELTSASLTFPTGEDNAEIDFMFKSGTTPTTLTLNGTNIAYDTITVEANKIVELNAKWYIDKWVILASQTSVGASNE